MAINLNMNVNERGNTDIRLVRVITCLKMANTDTVGLVSSSVRFTTGLFSAGPSTSQETFTVHIFSETVTVSFYLLSGTSQ